MYKLTEDEYRKVHEAIENLGAINAEFDEKVKLLKLVLMSQGEVCSFIVNFFVSLITEIADYFQHELQSMPTLKKVMDGQGIDELLK